MKIMLILSILVVIGLLFLGVGYVFFRFAISRDGLTMPGKPKLETGEADLRAWKKYEAVHQKDYSWCVSQPMEEVNLTSFDGLRLTGHYFACEHPKRIVLLAHGYRGQAFHDFASVTPWLHEQDCDLLLINQRSMGSSEGKYITFGAKEKKDIRSWCDYLESRNPDHLPIYLYGISMGCATVLLSTGENLPGDIRGIIADCGYSSVEEIFASQVSNSFHLKPYPLMYAMRFWCAVLARFKFDEADVKKTLRTNTIPVLFIHGSQDHFVYPDNTMRNYEANASEKTLVMIEGAIHASSYNEDTERYQCSVTALFQACESQHRTNSPIDIQPAGVILQVF